MTIDPHHAPSWITTLKFIKESAVDNKQVWELTPLEMKEVLQLASDIACEAANAQLNKFDK